MKSLIPLLAVAGFVTNAASAEAQSEDVRRAKSSSEQQALFLAMNGPHVDGNIAADIPKYEVKSAYATCRVVDIDLDGHPDMIGAAYVSQDGSPSQGSLGMVVATPSGDAEGAADACQTYPRRFIMVSRDLTLDLVGPDSVDDQVAARLERLTAGEPFGASALPAWAATATAPTIPSGEMIDSILDRQRYEALRSADMPVWCYPDGDLVCVAFADGYAEPLPVITIRQNGRAAPTVEELIGAG